MIFLEHNIWRYGIWVNVVFRKCVPEIFLQPEFSLNPEHFQIAFLE